MLISVKPAFTVRNLLNCRLRGGAGSVDDGGFVRVDVYAHGRHLEEGFDSQSPPERFSPHCEIETLGCRVQPCATPGQTKSRIGDDPGQVLTSVVPLKNNSQQFWSNITTTAAHTRSCHALGWPLTDPSQPFDRHYSSAWRPRSVPAPVLRAP